MTDKGILSSTYLYRTVSLAENIYTFELDILLPTIQSLVTMVVSKWHHKTMASFTP